MGIQVPEAFSLETLLEEARKNKKWYHYLMPSVTYNEALRLTTVLWRDCSYSTRSLTKLHRFDVLIANHPRFRYLSWVGFQIWHKR